MIGISSSQDSHPGIKHNQKKNSCDNFFQINKFLLYFSVSSVRYPTSASNSAIGPLNDSPDLRSLSEISSLPRGFGHSADSKSISWNLTIILHSIQIAIIRWCPFFYSTYSSFCNFMSLNRWDMAVRWFHDNSSQSSIWITFGFSDGSRYLRK